MIAITYTYQNVTYFMEQAKWDQQSNDDQNIRNSNFIEISSYYTTSFFIHYSIKPLRSFKLHEPRLYIENYSTHVPLIVQNL